MPATARESAKVTLSELDTFDGECLPERTVLSAGVGMPGGGVPTAGGSNPLSTVLGLVSGVAGGVGA